MLYGFTNKRKNKCKSKVNVTMRFGNQNRNMKTNWNKKPQDSNIALQKGRGGKLGVRGSIPEDASRHFSYISCFRET